MACRHPRGTNGRPQPATRPQPRLPPHSTNHRRSPPRIDAVPHAVPLAVDQASASVLALRDRPVAASLLPSQLLVVEALRRPVESAGHAPLAYPDISLPLIDAAGLTREIPRCPCRSTARSSCAAPCTRSLSIPTLPGGRLPSTSKLSPPSPMAAEKQAKCRRQRGAGAPV